MLPAHCSRLAPISGANALGTSRLDSPVGLMTAAVVAVSGPLPVHWHRLAPMSAAMCRLESVIGLVASFSSPVQSGPLLNVFTICTDLGRFTFLITLGSGGPFKKER